MVQRSIRPTSPNIFVNETKNISFHQSSEHFMYSSHPLTVRFVGLENCFCLPPPPPKKRFYKLHIGYFFYVHIVNSVWLRETILSIKPQPFQNVTVLFG